MLLGGTAPVLKAPQAEATFPGSNGKIVFLGGSPNTIETVDPSGSNLQPLLSSGRAPRWSPDGSKIAFSRGARIFVMDANGSNEKDITTNDTLSYYNPAWSPDGKQIAFQGLGHTNGEIWVMDSNGFNPHSVTPSTFVLLGGNDLIDWSPDGKRILFSGYSPDSVDLFTLNLADSSLTDITNTPDEYEDRGDWSPDGKQIVVIEDTANAYEIRVMNSSGGTQTTLLSISVPNGARWSPDGKRIVYGDNGVLFTMKSDGSDKIPLGVSGGEPDWGPNPAPVVFIHGFLGSRINCGASELWPNIHVIPPSRPNFPQMLLAADGISPAPGACAASVGDTLDRVLGPGVLGSRIYDDDQVPQQAGAGECLLLQLGLAQQPPTIARKSRQLHRQHTHNPPQHESGDHGPFVRRAAGAALR